MVVATVGDVEFVNRSQELEFLAGLLPPRSQQSSLVIIRSPAGYGKSRLTAELVDRYVKGSATLAIVDPLIRSKSGTVRIYDGYFVQRCAEELSKVAGEQYDPFGGFLGRQRWRSVRRKNPFTELRQMPGPRMAYALAVEYTERFFARGRYAPRQLLSSDTREAIAACGEYIDYVCRLTSTLLIIREAQHIDHESLRTFLQLNAAQNNQHLIFEYTAPTGRFDGDHEKLLQRELQGHTNAHLLDLTRLERSHLEHLLRRTGADSVIVNSDFYGEWDGNLRVLRELKYRVGFNRRLANEADISRAAPDLGQQLRDHLADLTAAQRWLLIVAAAHVEPIHRRVLFSTALTQAPHATDASLTDDLDALIREHGFLELRSDLVSLTHDDISAAIHKASAYQGLLALSEKGLRDHYRGLVKANDFTVVSMAAAIRRLFALCVRTRDVALLLQLTEVIDTQIRTAHDQTVYIDIAVDAVTQTSDLLPTERKRLVDWAGTLSYELNDFRNAIRLFEQVTDRFPIENAVLAFSQIELGAHDAALALAQVFRASPESGPLALVADAIEAGVTLDAGRWTECRALLDRIIERGTPERSAIVGHAFRLAAEMQEYPECTTTALKSVDWFRSNGLEKCAAYSALSASRFLARTGAIEEAMAMIEMAERVLHQSIRNQHIILNNRALVGMLAAAPDYQACADWLRQALRTSRDDFSDLTILSNLAVAHWKRGALNVALECVARCVPILDDPEFAERDIYWPVCFNLKQILDAAEDPIAAAAMAGRPARFGTTARINQRYWSYRYGETSTPDAALAYLLRFDYHPTALSHWQVDLEALGELKLESRGPHPGSSIPGT